MIDGTSVRIHHSAATLKKATRIVVSDEARGGPTTKIHTVTNGHGLPVKLAITLRQSHDAPVARTLLDEIGAGTMLFADRRL